MCNVKLFLGLLHSSNPDLANSSVEVSSMMFSGFVNKLWILDDTTAL